MSILTDLRDVVHTLIGVKKLASQFAYANDFTNVKTWRPWQTLEELSDPAQFPSGKVYVIGGTPGDKVNESREGKNMAVAEFTVMIGFQHYIVNVNDTAEIDTYVGFVEELDLMCQREVGAASNSPLFSWTRTAYLRDPDGIPLNFVGLRTEDVFESYFTAFYSTVVT